MSKRRHPNGVHIHDRELAFSHVQVGRLSIREYNLIDMARKLQLFNMLELHLSLGVSYDAAIRSWNRMKHCGILVGQPSEFRFTANGIAAFLEADRFMVEPESRPRKVQVNLRGADGRWHRHMAWEREAVWVRRRMVLRFGEWQEPQMGLEL